MQHRAFRRMCERITDRACAARKATIFTAVPPRFGQNPRAATVLVEGSAGEGVDGTRVQAGTRSASITGSLAVGRFGQGNAIRETDGASTGIPEAVIGVDVNPQWRRPERGSEARPGQKGPIGRSLARKVCEASQFTRCSGDYTFAPAVQGIRRPIQILGRGTKARPDIRLGRSGEYQRANAGRSAVVRPNGRSDRFKTRAPRTAGKPVKNE